MLICKQLLGDNFKLKTTLAISDFPLGIDRTYMDTLKPALFLRTWLATSPEGLKPTPAARPNSNHTNILTTSFTGSSSNEVVQTVVVPEMDEEDFEFSTVFKDQGGFDSMT